MSLEDKIKKLEELNARAELGGGSDRIERQHAAGRMTARERPNGMREEWTYDAAGRVETHVVKQDGVVEATATYTYASGRLESVLDSVHGGGTP